MQKGPDGDYHVGWKAELMWNGLGFYDWSDASSGGGQGSASGNYTNFMGITSASIIDRMRIGQSFDRKKSGAYGFWSSNSFRPTDRGYKDAARDGNTLEEVSVGTERKWIPLDNIFYETFITKSGKSGGLELQVGVNFEPNSRYTTYNWLQTITETKNDKISQRIDAPVGQILYSTNNPKDDYYVGKYYNKQGYDFIFFDAPQRPLNENVNWKAELSLIGQIGNGGYEILGTVSWGFSINNGIVNKSTYSTVMNPSNFHIAALNVLNLYHVYSP
jgi:hypothetical protein